MSRIPQTRSIVWLASLLLTVVALPAADAHVEVECIAAAR